MLKLSEKVWACLAFAAILMAFFLGHTVCAPVADGLHTGKINVAARVCECKWLVSADQTQTACALHQRAKSTYSKPCLC